MSRVKVEQDSFYYYSDSMKNDWEYSYISRRKSPFMYIIKDDKFQIYSENSPTKIESIDIQHLPIFLKWCKDGYMVVTEIKESSNSKLTVGKFLDKNNIRDVSIRYGHTRSVLKDRNREIIAHYITPYSGILIMRKKTPKNTFLSYKYIIPSLSYRIISFEHIDLQKAVEEIKRLKDNGISYSLTDEIDEQLKSSIFMEKL